MPHVTFIHGISNKPPAADLVRAWVATLADEDGIDLDHERVSYELVYWADLLYDAPLRPESAESLEAVDLIGAEEADVTWRTDGGEEAEVMASLAARIGFLVANAPAEVAAPAVEVDHSLELLPAPVARRLMKTFLRDVHHYLFNTTFSPRRDETYAIQEVIRDRVVQALQRGAEREPPHVAVTHSMGTVMAYDCLQRMPQCPRIDGLLTMGSPLGLAEIQHCFKPEWSRRDGFPSSTMTGRWVNVFDRLDLVAAADPALANDYRRDGDLAVTDIHEPNYGRWRHDVSKYLRGPTLRSELAGMLGVASR